MELSQISYGHSWCTFVTKCVCVWDGCVCVGWVCVCVHRGGGRRGKGKRILHVANERSVDGI